MSKFKVGDRVKDSQGRTGEVVRVDDFSDVLVRIDGLMDGHDGDAGDGTHDKRWYFKGMDIELTPTGPVVEDTVTVRRIVPGVYGRLRVISGELKSPTVLMGVEDGICTTQTHWTAPELRAAAVVLIQLADALEQN